METKTIRQLFNRLLQGGKLYYKDGRAFLENRNHAVLVPNIEEVIEELGLKPLGTTDKGWDAYEFVDPPVRITDWHIARMRECVLRGENGKYIADTFNITSEQVWDYVGEELKVFELRDKAEQYRDQATDLVELAQQLEDEADKLQGV